MAVYATRTLSESSDERAPDGSRLRTLLRVERGGMAHFELEPNQTSNAVAHRTVDEIWFFLGGRGELWRQAAGAESVVTVHEGVCATIPRGTHFQFRCTGDTPLSAICVTMPPWPGDTEAVRVPGLWIPDRDAR
jgi:mannose-6-phosphate isomerase-like protein (cupin superfamily)